MRMLKVSFQRSQISHLAITESQGRESVFSLKTKNILRICWQWTRDTANKSVFIWAADKLCHHMQAFCWHCWELTVTRLRILSPTISQSTRCWPPWPGNGVTPEFWPLVNRLHNLSLFQNKRLSIWQCVWSDSSSLASQITATLKKRSLARWKSFSCFQSLSCLNP